MVLPGGNDPTPTRVLRALVGSGTRSLELNRGLGFASWDTPRQPHGRAALWQPASADARCYRRLRPRGWAHIQQLPPALSPAKAGIHGSAASEQRSITIPCQWAQARAAQR